MRGGSLPVGDGPLPLEEVPVGDRRGPASLLRVPLRMTRGPRRSEEGPRPKKGGPEQVQEGPIAIGQGPIPSGHGPTHVHRVSATTLQGLLSLRKCKLLMRIRSDSHGEYNERNEQEPGRPRTAQARRRLHRVRNLRDAFRFPFPRGPRVTGNGNRERPIGRPGGEWCRQRRGDTRTGDLLRSCGAVQRLPRTGRRPRGLPRRLREVRRVRCPQRGPLRARSRRQRSVSSGRVSRPAAADPEPSLPGRSVSTLHASAPRLDRGRRAHLPRVRWRLRRAFHARADD
jgi:hypothetical protein